MNVAIVADAHLISPDDPNEGRRTARSAFVSAAPSFRQVIERLNAEEADHVIFTGDLVDYFSPENRDFALDILAGLNVPWHLTPGNHDFQLVTETEDDVVVSADRETATAGWTDAGVRLDNRVLDVGDVRFLLVDSALSEVPAGTAAWLREACPDDRYTVLCTHVPVDHPAVVSAITDREPDRPLEKYVQRGSPELWDRCLSGRVDVIFSGHLHFAATASIDGKCAQHILPLSIRRRNPRYPHEGTITILDTDDPTALRQFQLPPTVY